MFYEDKVDSVAGLKRRLAVLDQDAGVRLLGGSGRKTFFVFVTRFGPKYTVMTYAMGKGGAPSRRLSTIELDGLERTEDELKKLVKEPLRAWVY